MMLFRESETMLFNNDSYKDDVDNIDNYEDDCDNVYDQSYQEGFHPSQELDYEDDRDPDEGYDPDDEDEGYEEDPEDQEGPIEYYTDEDGDYEPNQDNRPEWDTVVGSKESEVVKEFGKHSDVLTVTPDKDNNTWTAKFTEGLNEEQKKDASEAIEDIKNLVDALKENNEDNQEHVEIEKSDSESVSIKFNYGKF